MLQLANRMLAMVVFTLGLAYAQELVAQPRDPEEPGADVIASGKCEVPVCTDVDFGDHLFRYYTHGRAIRLNFIPKGTCKCVAIRSGDKGFNGQIVAAVTTSDGKIFPNVSVLRIQKGENSKIDNRTSWERFQAVRNELVEFPDLRWDDDDFSSFKISAHPRIYPGNSRQLYFVPTQHKFELKGETQPIVFYTPLGYKIGNKEHERTGPEFSHEFN